MHPIVTITLSTKRIIKRDEYLTKWKWSSKFAQQYQISAFKQHQNAKYDEETDELLLVIIH